MDGAIPAGNGNVFTVLLAGGRGTRLHELTVAECKPALSFAGRARIVDFAMANAAASGLGQVLVATQFRPATLSRHLTDHWARRFPGGVALRDGAAVSRATGGYRGTADALRANLPEIARQRPDAVLVLSADHVYQMDYRPMIERHLSGGAAVTVAAQPVPLAQARAFGVIEAEADGRIRSFAEKPVRPRPLPADPARALVSMGIYLFDWRWLRMALTGGETGLRPDCDFGKHVLPAAVAQGLAAVYPVMTGDEPAYWRDVGTLDAYRLAQLDFARGELTPCEVPLAAGRGLRQGEATVIGDSVLMPGARVLPGARVQRVIAAPDAVLPGDLVVGRDPEEDRRWFRVTAQGTVLVTAAMLARRARERIRRLPFLPGLTDA